MTKKKAEVKKPSSERPGVRYSTYLKRETYDRLSQLAAADSRTISNMIRICVERYLEHEDGGK